MSGYRVKGQNAGTDNVHSKLTEDQVREIRQQLAGCEHCGRADSTYTIAKRFNVRQSTIQAIKQGKTWTTLK